MTSITKYFLFVNSAVFFVQYQWPSLNVCFNNKAKVFEIIHYTQLHYAE